MSQKTANSKKIKKLSWSDPIIVFLMMGWAALLVEGQERDKKENEEKRFGVVVLPVVFYMPETKWGGGAGGLITYRPLHSPAGARPSSLYFYAIYTQLRQFSTQINPEIYFKGEDYLLTGTMVGEEFPDKFWGVGKATEEEAEEDFTPRTASVEMSFQRRIWTKHNVYAGIYGQFEAYNIVKVEPGGLLEKEVYRGSKKGKTSSFGLILNWDTRDNIFFPRRGYYFQLLGHLSRDFLGSDFETTSVKLDLRRFMPILSTHVLAWQALFQSIQGEPSFRNYAKLGGDSIMRGYYSGRYRDKYLLALQAEYRLPLWKRLGMVGFAGLGDVASRLKDFKFSEAKYSLGFGFRFKVSPREGTNLRLDFAWGRGTSGFYFTAGESF